MIAERHWMGWGVARWAVVLSVALAGGALSHLVLDRREAVAPAPLPRTTPSPPLVAPLPAAPAPPRRSPLSPAERLRWAQDALRSASADTRREGLAVLLTGDEEAGLRAARAALDDPDLVHTAASTLLFRQPPAPADLAAVERRLGDRRLDDATRDALRSVLLLALVRGGSAKAAALAGELLGAKAPEARGGALAAITALPAEQAVPLLLRALEDPDPRIVRVALDHLVHDRGGDPGLGADPKAWRAWWQRRGAAK